MDFDLMAPTEQLTLERKRAIKRRWRQKNPGYALRWVREKRKDPNFRKQESLRQRAYQKRHPLQYARQNYVGSARLKGLAFELDHEVFQRMVMSACFYCGVEPSPLNGIDRIDSAQGYIAGNVVTACRQCNIAKHDDSLAEFADWIKRVSQRVDTWRP